MRFILHEPNIGDQKIINKFLWWPTKIGNELRWLEKVIILYEYKQYGTMEYGIVFPYEKWVAIKFISI